MTTTRFSTPPRGWLFVLLLFTALAATAQGQTTTGAGLGPIRQYIAAGWDHLTRSMTDCASIVDPKMKVAPVLYVPAGFAVPPAIEKLHAGCNVEIEHLPKPIRQLGEIDTSTFHPHGLISTSFLAAASTKCTAGIVISLLLACCATGAPS